MNQKRCTVPVPSKKQSQSENKLTKKSKAAEAEETRVLAQRISEIETEKLE